MLWVPVQIGRASCREREVLMPSVVFTPPLSEQVPAAGVNEPGPAKIENVTVPEGSDLVPADWVSVTVTVQVRSWFSTAGSWKWTEVVVGGVSCAMSSPVESALEECTAEPG